MDNCISCGSQVIHLKSTTNQGLPMDVVHVENGYATCEYLVIGEVIRMRVILPIGELLLIVKK